MSREDITVGAIKRPIPVIVYGVAAPCDAIYRPLTAVRTAYVYLLRNVRTRRTYINDVETPRREAVDFHCRPSVIRAELDQYSSLVVIAVRLPY